MSRVGINAREYKLRSQNQTDIGDGNIAGHCKNKSQFISNDSITHLDYKPVHSRTMDMKHSFSGSMVSKRRVSFKSVVLSVR